jgi:dynein heavy chain
MNGDAGDWESARAFLADSSVATKKAKADVKKKKTKKKANVHGHDEVDDVGGSLLQRLNRYRKEAVEDDTVRRLQKYVRAQNFNPMAVQQVSMAARSLCEWVLAVDGYAKIRAAVGYKESKLREADAKVAATREALAVKGRDLAAAKRTLALLQEEHGDARGENEALEAARSEAQTHLEHIKSLVDSFATQRRRWGEARREAETAMRTATGDSLAAAAAIAYLGPFDEVFRRRLSAEWASILARHGIPCEPAFTLARYLRRGHPSAALPLPKGERLDVPLTDSILLTLNAAKPPLLLDPEV